MNAMGNGESKRKPSDFTRFVVADLQGNTQEITPDNFTACEILSGKDEDTLVYYQLKQFVKNELTHRSDTRVIPKHVTYMKDHELLD